jgi:hypothetical protein
LTSTAFLVTPAWQIVWSGQAHESEERDAEASTERGLEGHVVGVLLPEAQRTPHLGTGGNP